jgi:hypothetical protein
MKGNKEEIKDKKQEKVEVMQGFDSLHSLCTTWPSHSVVGTTPEMIPTSH